MTNAMYGLTSAKNRHVSGKLSVRNATANDTHMPETCQDSKPGRNCKAEYDRKTSGNHKVRAAVEN